MEPAAPHKSLNGRHPSPSAYGDIHFATPLAVLENLARIYLKDMLVLAEMDGRR